MKYFLVILLFIVVAIVIFSRRYDSEHAPHAQMQADLFAAADEVCFDEMRKLFDLPRAFKFESYKLTYDRFGVKGVRLSVFFDQPNNRQLPAKVVCLSVDGKLQQNNGIQVTE